MQYCKDCGKQLTWKEDPVSLERIGWKCLTCDKEWLNSEHDIDVVCAMMKVKENG